MVSQTKKMDLNHFPAISIIMESDSWNNFQFHGTKLDFFLTGIKKIVLFSFKFIYHPIEGSQTLLFPKRKGKFVTEQDFRRRGLSVVVHQCTAHRSHPFSSLGAEGTAARRRPVPVLHSPQRHAIFQRTNNVFLS
jgi:hypothetical protein